MNTTKMGESPLPATPLDATLVPAIDEAAQSLRDADNARKMLRYKAEVKYQTSAASLESMDAVSRETVHTLLHELRVHQIELEMQNDELQRALDEADLARERLVDLYDLAPVGYCSVNAAGLVVQANLTLASLLDVPRGALVDQPFSRFVSPQDQDVFYRLSRLMVPVAATDDACTHELRMHRSDGTVFWAGLQARLVTAPEPMLRVVVSDISQRKHMEAALQASRGMQNVLLHEVHHRVKNNLQIINSLLRLESSRSEQRETKSVLLELQGRIRAIAILHELLYRESILASVDLGHYLRELTTQVFRAEAGLGDRVRLKVDLASLSGGMDQAVACGLWVNELVTNSLKHGFPDGRSGEVCIALQLLPVVETGRVPVRLCVSDTGVGLGSDFWTRPQTTLGLQLVHDLSKQLGGVLEITSPSGAGATFAMMFSVDQSKLPR